MPWKQRDNRFFPDISWMLWRLKKPYICIRVCVAAEMEHIATGSVGQRITGAYSSLWSKHPVTLHSIHVLLQFLKLWGVGCLYIISYLFSDYSPKIQHSTVSLIEWVQFSVCPFGTWQHSLWLQSLSRTCSNRELINPIHWFFQQRPVENICNRISLLTKVYLL